MNATDKLSPKPRLPGRRFVKRMYLMRLLGTFLCFIPVLSVLIEHHRSVWLMILLGANAFIWPTVAWLRARHSPTPLSTEHQHLVLDAGAGGFCLLEKRIDHELNKLRQTCRESTLMFIDIDNFKEVNDRFGHKVGDAMLATVSKILHLATRPSDTPARLGGDEFVILLPDTSVDEAQIVATRIMDAAAVMKDVAQEAVYCTLSIGIACATRDTSSVADWLQAADSALYHAKREGKNRIFAH